MLDPLAEIVCRSRHFESRLFCGFGASSKLLDLSFQFFRYAFVGVETEDPFARGLLGGEVLLSRVAGPGPNEYTIREAARNLSRGIGALRIDDDDFVRPPKRFKRRRDVVFFVEGDNGGGDLHCRVRSILFECAEVGKRGNTVTRKQPEAL